MKQYIVITAIHNDLDEIHSLHAKQKMSDQKEEKKIYYMIPLIGSLTAGNSMMMEVSIVVTWEGIKDWKE